MGQAKNRGTHAERVQQAIARNKAAAERRAAGMEQVRQRSAGLAAAMRAADSRQSATVLEIADGLQVVALAAYGAEI